MMTFGYCLKANCKYIQRLYLKIGNQGLNERFMVRFGMYMYIKVYQLLAVTVKTDPLEIINPTDQEF